MIKSLNMDETKQKNTFIIISLAILAIGFITGVATGIMLFF